MVQLGNPRLECVSKDRPSPPAQSFGGDGLVGLLLDPASLVAEAETRHNSIAKVVHA